MKQRIVLIIAVLLGLLAALLTRRYLNAKDSEFAAKVAALNKRHRTVSVVTVNKNIPKGTILQVSDIGAVQVVENQLRSDAVLEDDYRDVLGRKTLHNLDVGKPLFWVDIEGGAPGRRGLADDIKPGCRALSINVSGASSVSGMVRPNDHVDVVGTFSFPSKEFPDQLELVTLTVVQDVTVVATGTKTAKSSSAMLSQSSTYNTVTLEVTPREAEMLVFAEQIKGRLTLALRNPSDVHYESDLPRVNFEKIESEIEELNLNRQLKLLKKRPNNN